MLVDVITGHNAEFGLGLTALASAQAAKKETFRLSSDEQFLQAILR
jgi:hypothetical protein